MALIQRDQVQPPVLRKQTVPVPGLGGDVIVQGLLLSEIMESRHVNDMAKVPLEGESEDHARARAGGRLVAFTLAKTVVLADGKPLFTEDQWEVFGAEHPGDVLELYNVASSLNGRSLEDTKKN